MNIKEKMKKASEIYAEQINETIERYRGFITAEFSRRFYENPGIDSNRFRRLHLLVKTKGLITLDREQVELIKEFNCTKHTIMSSETESDKPTKPKINTSVWFSGDEGKPSYW